MQVQILSSAPEIDRVRKNLVDFLLFIYSLFPKTKPVDFEVIGNSEQVKSEVQTRKGEGWVELLIESRYYEDKTILDKYIELKKILISSINTANKNQKQKGF